MQKRKRKSKMHNKRRNLETTRKSQIKCINGGKERENVKNTLSSYSNLLRKFLNKNSTLLKKRR